MSLYKKVIIYHILFVLLKTILIKNKSYYIVQKQSMNIFIFYNKKLIQI